MLRIFFLSFSGLSTWGRKVGRKFDQIKINDPNEKLHYVVTPPSPASSSIHARPASSICSNSHEDHNCTLLVISVFRSISIVFCKLDLLLFGEKNSQCHFWRNLLSFLSLSCPRNEKGMKKQKCMLNFNLKVYALIFNQIWTKLKNVKNNLKIWIWCKIPIVPLP